MTDSKEMHSNQSVLIVGAGISGMQSALLLAEAGHKVYLLDTAPGIGGSMHLLDLTFPTNSCGLCLMLPGRAAYCPSIECDLHQNIEILPYSEVAGVTGEAGDFTVTVRHKPRHVRVDLCNNCGLCAQVCPEARPDRYEGDLDSGKAIYRPPVRAIPPAYVIDMEYCTRCGKCVEACPAQAVELEMAGTEAEINVGAVVLSPGFEPFDARLKGEYGFGHYDNVLSSIQFERMVSIAGSTGATVVRPSDGQTPRRVAFIQCVGSRDDSVECGYCSSVCCMYTAKQVAVAKKIQPDLDVTVYFMDIRAHGKDFDEYFDGVESLPGVTYRRCMVSSVHQYQQTRNLMLNYVTESGDIKEEDFDMVVLSVGFAPPVGFRQLGQALGVEMNAYGFCVTDTFAPSASSQPGILVGGAFREPKDIPETVVEASAVAAQAARLLGEPVVESLPSPDPSLKGGEAEAWPRVGVFLCDCRGDIGEVVDLEALTAHSQGLRDVAVVQSLDNACLNGGAEQIKQAVAEHELNRVVLAGCSARLYEPAFAQMMNEVGLNPGLLERVNLRGEVAWAHSGNGNGTGANVKAQDLVEMGVASARLRKPVLPTSDEVTQRALVVGGGLAGMTAALNLAEMGYEVDLVEQSAELGGQLRELRYTLAEKDDPTASLQTLVEGVEGNERINVYRETQVEDVSGWAGQFTTTVARPGDKKNKETLQHGAVIVATGGHEVVSTEYLYGQNDQVITQRELEHRLADSGNQIPNTIVMIQCVGSREPERPYCSRVCCSKAIANALKIKEQNPQANVLVLYREMRTYGFREDYYREARSQGVTFVRYELPDKPQVSANGGGVTVKLKEPITGQEMVIDAGLLVLSTGVEPNDNQALADVLDVSVDKNGFFQEEYPKMRPLDFERRGIFLCGLAHSPRAADETISQAQGAAMRAATVLAKPTLETVPTVASVNTKRCSACGLCVDVCPFGARVMETGAPHAEVVEVLCQGCGTCVVACPNKASNQTGIEVGQVYAMLDVV
ncbi:MAG: CoB--CoM heterodisulfide reductase iron-sulfur subunit A family protein [Chloroflexi bacterium]|nr:CoB--CoM heterodisulfide reductase iron-sulfur subunit A family protein [Chloroflexota bacterium]